jgi:hypothetical protein
MRRAIVAAVLAIVTMTVSLPIFPTAAQEPCRFVLGFAALRDAIGAQKVGNCLEDEHFNLENGNAEQRTSGGLLVWRKVDNFTAFTDGGTSWINGPNGLQSRPNGERFSWEKDPVQNSAVPAPPSVPSVPAAVTPTTPPRTVANPPASAPSVAPRPATATPRTEPSTASGGNCHPSYPDFCIPPPPPDVNCTSAVINGRKNFRVTGPDPHRLDQGGRPGIACES